MKTYNVDTYSSKFLDIYLNIHIPIKKIVRDYTKHPLSNFVPYHRLNHSFKAFPTKLSSESIFINVQDALKDSKWNEAIFKEMRALHKNEAWEVIELPR